jgi:hypothetical protein
MENVIRGYKVADSNGRCRGYQFEVGKRYKHDGTIRLCKSGFHFCIKASHCFDYYFFLLIIRYLKLLGMVSIKPKMMIVKYVLVILKLLGSLHGKRF